VPVSNHQGRNWRSSKQQQHVEGVVDRLPQPVVAVVPGADLLPVQARQFRGEDLIQVGLGVAADGGIAGVDGEVLEVVQPREQADLAELAHPGEEGEADMGVRILDHRIEIAQPIAHRQGGVRIGDVVQDRLVVFIHQHHGALAAGGMGLLDQLAETADDVGLIADR
jgi:hypothetical protein